MQLRGCFYSAGTLSRTSKKYDFSGNILISHEIHGADVKETIFTYDRRGRLLTDKTLINGRDEAGNSHSYDGLGRLAGKRYGEKSRATTDQVGMPIVEYSYTAAENYGYTIQSWLINQFARLADNPSLRLFNMTLNYDNPIDLTDSGITITPTPSYTGNITQWIWDNGQTRNLYNLDYDDLGGLTDAHKYVFSLSGAPTGIVRDGQFEERGITYDRNGNMVVGHGKLLRHHYNFLNLLNKAEFIRVI